MPEQEPEQVMVVRRLDVERAMGSVPARQFVPVSESAPDNHRFRYSVPARVVADVVAHGRFVPRTPELEDNPGLKQIIVYAVLVDGGQGRVCVYRRNKGGEARLDGKASVGLGGHVNRTPAAYRRPPMEPGQFRWIPQHVGGPTSLFEDVEYSLRKELHEEARVDVKMPWLIGLVNDDTTRVGSVHLGLVYLCEVLPSYVVPAPEVEILGWFDAYALGKAVEGNLVWKTLKHPISDPGDPGEMVRVEDGSTLKFEPWSELVVPHLGRVYVSKPPSSEGFGRVAP